VFKEKRKRFWFREKLKQILGIKEESEWLKHDDNDYHELFGIKKSSEQLVLDDKFFQEVLKIKRMPKAGSLDNVQARKWYLFYMAKIDEAIDKTVTSEEQAMQAYQIRDWIRTTTKELMADRELALQLEQAEPNLTLEQVRQRQIKKGLSYGDLTWEGVISSSTRSRDSVNEQLGVDPHKNEIEINPLWRPYVKTPRSRDKDFEDRIIAESSLSNYEESVREERNWGSFNPKQVEVKKQRKVIELEI
jgi:hypothetical protein